MKIIFALSVFYFAVTGWGRLLAWIACSRKGKLNNEIEIYHLFPWLGLPAIFIVVSTYHWFLPVSINFSRTVLLLGVIYFTHYIVQHWKKLHFQDLLIFVASLIAGYWAQGREALFYDSLLYHIPTIMWHQAEPVVLGLANLHSRFGYNSAWLTISSVFYFPGLGMRAVYLGQALLPMMLTSFVLKQIASREIVSLRLCFFFFVALAGLLMTGALQNATSNDTVVAVLVIMSGFLFVSLLDQPHSNDSDTTKPLIGLLTLCSISLLAIMTKLSAAPLAIFMIGFLMISKSSSCLPKISLGIGWCLALMSVLWIAQNFALSGCLAYPVSFSCSSAVDWAVGAEAAKSEANEIIAWARHPGLQYMTSLGNLDWIRDYYSTHKKFQHLSQEMLFFTALVIWVAASIRFLKVHNRAKFMRSLPIARHSGIHPWIPLLVCLAGIALWAVAPSPRFGFGFFALLPASLAYLILPGEHVNESIRQSDAVKKWVFIAIFGVSIILFLVLPPASDNLEKDEFQDANFLIPTYTRTTRSGMPIQIPVTEDACGTAPLPCTPYFTDALVKEKILWLSMWKIQK